MKNVRVYSNGEPLLTALTFTFPEIDTKPFKRAFKKYSGAMEQLHKKLSAARGQYYWFGFDGSAEYYKEQEQKKNRQLLPGTCIGAIK